jgi:hypothetical protein
MSKRISVPVVVMVDLVEASDGYRFEQARVTPEIIAGNPYDREEHRSLPWTTDGVAQAYVVMRQMLDPQRALADAPDDAPPSMRELFGLLKDSLTNLRDTMAFAKAVRAEEKHPMGKVQRIPWPEGDESAGVITGSAHDDSTT